MPLSGSASAKAGLELSESELSDARVGHLDEKALRIAMQNFQQIDRNNDGKLDLEEFRSGMGMLGVDKTFSTIVFNSFDTGGDGWIDRREFLVAMAVMLHPDKLEDQIDLAFDAYDRNKDGKLVMTDWLNGLEHWGDSKSDEEFVKLRNEITTHLDELQECASSLATLDVLLGLAETAQLYQHTRPLLDDSRDLEIIDGRHPVLEQTLVEEKFVPNDSSLHHEDSRLLIITGPNMAGKSTYIRQVALIVLMAQIGAYVPAGSARIGIVDRIFCRVGASDDLARGQSTFMVEMNETSLIVNNATDRSLVILDEIGRGTATFDGLSIAWSVAEHLHDRIQCRALFATHYHELCDLAHTREAVNNHNVAVREWKEEIIFLRKILPGPADKSYGIQVARLAGLPAPIIDRAKEILTHLEMSAARPRGQESKAEQPSKESPFPQTDSPQMDLFNT